MHDFFIIYHVKTQKVCSSLYFFLFRNTDKDVHSPFTKTYATLGYLWSDLGPQKAAPQKTATAGWLPYLLHLSPSFLRYQLPKSLYNIIIKQESHYHRAARRNFCFKEGITVTVLLRGRIKKKWGGKSRNQEALERGSFDFEKGAPNIQRWWKKMVF